MIGMLAVVWDSIKFIATSALGGYQKQQDVDLEKYKVDGRVSEKALDAALEIDKARVQQNIADNANMMTRMIRPAFAGAVILYIWAIVIDSVWGDGTAVLAVPKFIQDWMFLILTAYFGGRSLEKVAQAYFDKRK